MPNKMIIKGKPKNGTVKQFNIPFQIYTCYRKTIFCPNNKGTLKGMKNSDVRLLDLLIRCRDLNFQ